MENQGTPLDILSHLVDTQKCAEVDFGHLLQVLSTMNESNGATKHQKEHAKKKASRASYAQSA
jgi:hypothetical protein